MIQTLTLYSKKEDKYAKTHLSGQSHKKDRFFKRVNKGTDFNPCLGCVCYIASSGVSCYALDCGLSNDCKDNEIWEKVNIFNFFQSVFKDLQNEGIVIYTKIPEISNQLMEDINRLYIHTYNPLITKKILAILKSPLKFGYELGLSVRNDELIISYTWKQ